MSNLVEPRLRLEPMESPHREPNPTAVSRTQKTVFENGLRVITEFMPEVRSISIGIVAEVGSSVEDSSQVGLSHLIEHSLFQGTSTRDAKQIALMMDLAGGQIGAFTTRDYTCYCATVLDEHSTYALDLFGDIFLNSTFPEEQLQREKEAILREMAGNFDTPSVRAHDLLKGFAWAGHPLGQSIAGTPESVRSHSREDVIYFFHEKYVPDNIIVAASGNLDHDDFVAHVCDGFWRMLGQKSPSKRTTPKFQSGVVFEERDVSQAYFALGLPAFPYAYEDRYTFHILNNILGGGGSSRLFAKLREHHGLVYEVGSDYHAYRNGGMLIIEGSTAPECLLDALGLILLEIRDLAESVSAINEEETWKAQMNIRRQFLLASESSSTRMNRLATQELYFGEPIPAREILEAIEGVNAESVQQLATNYLKSARRGVALAVVGPEKPDCCTQSILEDFLADMP